MQTKTAEYTEFLEFEEFKNTFGNGGASNFEILRRAGIAIEHLNHNGLIYLNHILYKKWPHSRNKRDLINGVKRAVQSRFYEKLYGIPPSAAMLKRDEVFKELLCLCDEPVQEIHRAKKIGEKMNEQENNQTQENIQAAQEQSAPPVQNAQQDAQQDAQQNAQQDAQQNVQQDAPEQKPKKEKKEKTEYQKKVAVMSLEDLIKWALELGIPQEKIDKHKGKASGLAKMNISNMVRIKLNNPS